MKITETIELRLRPILNLIVNHDDKDSTYRLAALDRVIELVNECKAEVAAKAAAQAEADFAPQPEE